MGERAPFRLTGEPPEDIIHEAVAGFLTGAGNHLCMVLPPAVFFCYPAGHIPLAPAQIAKLVRAGLRRGMPDFMGLYDSRSYGIELKREGGRLSKGYMGRTAKGGLIWREGQVEMFGKLIAAGMSIQVCRSLEEVIVTLRNWNIPMRRFT